MPAVIRLTRLNRLPRPAALAALLVIGSGMLGACSSTPAPVPPLPAAGSSFRHAADLADWAEVPPAETRARGDWWRVFNDPVLDNLVERAERQNTDIAAALARLSQARAVLGATGARQQPQAGFGGGATRQGGPLVNAAGDSGTLLTLSASLSYEVDLAGRLSRQSEAAARDADAQQAALQSTRLLVQAAVAQTYLALRSSDDERALLRDSSQAQATALALAERRVKAGLAAESSLPPQRAALALARSEQLALERRRTEHEHALALLIGGSASSFSVADSTLRATLPTVPPGIPSAVLARRPDVAAAQQALLAGQARLGAARTAWFPSLALTASGGQASPDLATLLQASTRAWGLGALLSLPLLDGGRRDSLVAQADAEVQALSAAHRSQVLGAFKDVEDQLLALRSLAERDGLLAQAAEADGHSAALAESRARQGLSSQLEALEAVRNALRSRRAALQVHAARFQATVGLIRALGGSWDGPPPGADQQLSRAPS